VGAKTFSLQGRLVSGSIQYCQTPCEYRFRVAGETHEIEVRYPSCVLPDTVRDLKGRHVDITARGKFTSAGFFQAQEVIGKCPSKEGYQQDMGTRPELIEPTRLDCTQRPAK
jgi:cytochrome c-type biogenesis protein CcmE